jgi:undecaprenyl-diphosphatase
VIDYPEALVIGVLQGVTELFPVSSLGHSILLPAVVGGSWARDLNVAAPESPYLAFVVGLHVATALALLIHYRRDWIRIVGGLVTSVRWRRVETADERLAWMIVLATIPVGISGLLLEHTFRTVLGRPTPAAIFLMINGVVLFAAEWLRRRSVRPVTTPDGTVYVSRSAAVPSGVFRGHPSAGFRLRPGAPEPAASEPAVPEPAAPEPAAPEPAAPEPAASEPAEAIGEATGDDPVEADGRLAAGSFAGAVAVGCAQILALLPGISRSGATMAAGLAKGLSHEDAARFSFLLATPVILAAGVLKLPDLTGPLGAGIRGPVLAGSLASGIAAYLSVRFLTRYFETRTLTPFAIYCLAAGAAALAWFTLS